MATGLAFHASSNENAYHSKVKNTVGTHPNYRRPFIHRLSGGRTISGYGNNSFLKSKSSDESELQMENLYMEWTIEDDKLLFNNINDPLPTLAAKLGRGLRGVQKRIAKLNDVQSAAYQRLFVGEESLVPRSKSEGNESRLTPASEVLKRIKWDFSLDPDDFTLGYYDRVEDKVLSVNFAAKNLSVKGKEELFVFAIPEHRIMSLHYKERVVWDKVRLIVRLF